MEGWGEVRYDDVVSTPVGNYLVSHNCWISDLNVQGQPLLELGGGDSGTRPACHSFPQVLIHWALSVFFFSEANVQTCHSIGELWRVAGCGLHICYCQTGLGGDVFLHAHNWNVREKFCDLKIMQLVRTSCQVDQRGSPGKQFLLILLWTCQQQAGKLFFFPCCFSIWRQRHVLLGFVLVSPRHLTVSETSTTFSRSKWKDTRRKGNVQVLSGPTCRVRFQTWSNIRVPSRWCFSLNVLLRSLCMVHIPNHCLRLTYWHLQ